MALVVTKMTSNEYDDLRWELLTAAEARRNKPYIDSAHANKVTMGVGFNIEVKANLEAVLSSLGVDFIIKTWGQAL